MVVRRFLLVATLACGAWPEVATAQATDRWFGQNGWQIVLAKVPDHGMQCILGHDSAQSDHQLGWVWDNTYGLYLQFMDGNALAANDQNMNQANLDQRSKFVVAIDGKVIEARPDIRSLVTMHTGQVVAFSPPRLLAFNSNNPEDGSRPKSDAVFDMLRVGRTLTIETYGASYADDLRGVGAALDQFPACISRKQQIADAENAH